MFEVKVPSSRLAAVRYQCQGITRTASSACGHRRYSTLDHTKHTGQIFCSVSFLCALASAIKGNQIDQRETMISGVSQVQHGPRPAQHCPGGDSVCLLRNSSSQITNSSQPREIPYFFLPPKIMALSLSARPTGATIAGFSVTSFSSDFLSAAAAVWALPAPPRPVW